MLISSAYAQAAGGAGGAFDLMSLLPLVLIFVVFYFLLIRPQQKRMKQHKEMLGSLRRGDKVVTNGGIVGTIVKVLNQDELQIEIADGVRVKAMRGMVASVVSKTEPAEGAEDDATDAEKPKA